MATNKELGQKFADETSTTRPALDQRVKGIVEEVINRQELLDLIKVEGVDEKVLLHGNEIYRQVILCSLMTESVLRMAKGLRIDDTFPGASAELKMLILKIVADAAKLGYAGKVVKDAVKN